MTKVRPHAAPVPSESFPATRIWPAELERDEDVKAVLSIVMSESALFEALPDEHCDACGRPSASANRESDYGLGGNGVYLSLHGNEARLETVPLCSSCTAAIGVTALARSQIEEEEG
ncbi:MAG: hypothetical protein M3O50_12460 [Myxococcota bacterium]|nr:hypothetical protein [Myxococcota bacterium]